MEFIKHLFARSNSVIIIQTVTFKAINQCDSEIRYLTHKWKIGYDIKKKKLPDIYSPNKSKMNMLLYKSANLIIPLFSNII